MAAEEEDAWEGVSGKPFLRRISTMGSSPPPTHRPGLRHAHTFNATHEGHSGLMWGLGDDSSLLTGPLKWDSSSFVGSSRASSAVTSPTVVDARAYLPRRVRGVDGDHLLRLL